MIYGFIISFVLLLIDLILEILIFKYENLNKLTKISNVFNCGIILLIPGI